RVLPRFLQRAANDPRGAGRDPGPRAIERAHRDLETVALGPDDGCLADLHLLEDDVGRVGAALPHLVLFLADRQPGRLPVDDEAGDPFVAGRPFFAREHGIEARDAAVRDPALLPGDDVVVAHLLVAGLHPRDVRPGIRFGATVGREDRLGEQAAEVLLLLPVA